jgi:large subunit ribosomal protein L1
MNKKLILQALSDARQKTKERKFSQSIDLIVTLRDLNLKNPEEQVEFFALLPHVPKKRKVCALVGPELSDKASEVMDKVISHMDFDQYKDKKALKKIAGEYDYFVAQADVMPKVAGVFGRALGPRGKMPNPKAGQIIPPRAPVQPVYERLQKTVRVVAKKQLATQLIVGDQSMNDEVLAENILSAYDQIIHHLPRESHNIKGVYVKLTMGSPIKIV